MTRWALRHGAGEEQARAVVLTTLVLFMAFHVYNSRSERQSLFRMNPLRNPFLRAPHHITSPRAGEK